MVWRGKLTTSLNFWPRLCKLEKEKLHNVAHWCRSMFHIIWKLMILAKYFLTCQSKERKTQMKDLSIKSQVIAKEPKRRQGGLGILFAYFSSCIYLFIFERVPKTLHCNYQYFSNCGKVPKRGKSNVKEHCWLCFSPQPNTFQLRCWEEWMISILFPTETKKFSPHHLKPKKYR